MARRWVRSAAVSVILAFICLTSTVFTLGYYLDLGRDPVLYRESESGLRSDECERPLQRKYSETLSQLTPKASDANLDWVTKTEPGKEYRILDEWYQNDAGVLIHNIGVTHVYNVFARNAAKLTAVIRSASVFAKEAYIFGGDSLNQYARSNHVLLLDMKEGRSRIAVLFTGKALLGSVEATWYVWLVLSIAVICTIGVKKGRYVAARNSLTIIAFSALAAGSALVPEVAIRLHAFVATIDWGGHQSAGSGPSITRWLNRHTRPFSTLVDADTVPMVTAITDCSSCLKKGDVLLVLTGESHARFIGICLAADRRFVQISHPK